MLDYIKSHNISMQFVFFIQGEKILTHVTLPPSTAWEISRCLEISSRPNVPKVYVEKERTKFTVMIHPGSSWYLCVVDYFAHVICCNKHNVGDKHIYFLNYSCRQYDSALNIFKPKAAREISRRCMIMFCAIKFIILSVRLLLIFCFDW